MRVTRVAAAVVVAAATMTAATTTALIVLSAPAGATVVQPFTLDYSGRVYGDFLTVGNTVLVSPSGSPRCTDVMERKSATGNNNDSPTRTAPARARPSSSTATPRGPSHLTSRTT